MIYTVLFRSVLMLNFMYLNRSYRLTSLRTINRLTLRSTLSTAALALSQKDCLMTGLNGAQDISVKVVSCKDILQDMMRRNELSPLATKYLGELVVCSLMMGAGLKGEESLQLNLVGNRGIKNIIAITDGDLNVRGSVGDTQFGVGIDLKDVHPSDLLGEGQVQIVRNHPAWKHPMNGITEWREVSIPMNLALYMSESEQRPSALVTDIQVVGDKVVSALGLMMETLPGASTENIEQGIANLAEVQKKGLQSFVTEYFHRESEPIVITDVNAAVNISTLSGGELSSDERSRAQDLFNSLDSPLDKILDACMVQMDTGSIRWDKKPTFKCTCGVEKVWRALKLLEKKEIKEIVASQEDVKMKCEFCGEKYVLGCDDIRTTILNE